MLRAIILDRNLTHHFWLLSPISYSAEVSPKSFNRELRNKSQQNLIQYQGILWVPDGQTYACDDCFLAFPAPAAQSTTRAPLDSCIFLATSE
jgi:hypothetical protein